MSDSISRRDLLRAGAAAGSVLAFSSFDLAPKAAAAQNKTYDKPVRLTSNENPYGFSPRAERAIRDSVRLGNQYADRGRIAELERMIADRENLKPENVVIGSGSGEVLCMAGAAYGWRAGGIVAPDLTFPLLFAYAENFGAPVVKVPLDENYRHDLPGMEKKVTKQTALCYVCNPNNPTGTYLPANNIRDFCEEVSGRTTIFVDEAYLEYTDEFPKNSMVELVRRGHPVIVSRTFSKIYGMAGMRIGYGLAPKEIADRLKKFRMTWFNSLGVNAAIESYKDTDFINMSREKNARVRDFLYREFSRMKLPHARSQGNFIWVRVGAENRDLADKMRPAGLLVRTAPPPHQDWARITIGTAEQMKRFAGVLEKHV